MCVIKLLSRRRSNPCCVEVGVGVKFGDGEKLKINGN